MTQDSVCFLRAIRGPVMMITIGALFALDNFTQFSFGRTWPVLLVVIGILNLGRSPGPRRGRMRYQAQWGTPPTPVPPPPPPPFTGTSWAPSGTATAPPGSYRGSAYEKTPGSIPRPRPSENRERPSAPQSPAGTRPPGAGGAQ